jgi:hypothetical protein
MATLLAACGGNASTPTGTGGAGGSDGKYHPPTNGVVMSESDACTAIQMAQSSDHLKLSCTATGELCPDLLRDQFGMCFEYDQGTVQGCVAYYAMATTCDALATAIDMCAVATIAGSAPKGCP